MSPMQPRRLVGLLAASGETNFLQSSLTRAILFSACTTAMLRQPVALTIVPERPAWTGSGPLGPDDSAATAIFQPALYARQQFTGGKLSYKKGWMMQKSHSHQRAAAAILLPSFNDSWGAPVLMPVLIEPARKVRPLT